MTNPSISRPTADECLSIIMMEYSHLFWDYHTLLALFGGSAQRIAIIQAISPKFFARMQQVLEQQALLSLRRLTDPGQTKVSGSWRDNLSVRFLIDHLRWSDQARRADCVERCERLRLSIAPLERWVDRHIAHNDLASKAKIEPLPPPLIQEIGLAIDELGEILDVASRELTDTEWHIDEREAIVPVEELLSYMLLGKQEFQRRRQLGIQGKLQLSEVLPRID